MMFSSFPYFALKLFCYLVIQLTSFILPQLAGSFFFFVVLKLSGFFFSVLFYPASISFLFSFFRQSLLVYFFELYRFFFTCSVFYFSSYHILMIFLSLPAFLLVVVDF